MNPREISKETLYLISVEVAIPVRAYVFSSLTMIINEVDEGVIADFDKRKVERYPQYVERKDLQAQPTKEIVAQLADETSHCDLATLINVFIMHFDLLQEIGVADRLLFSAFHALKTVRNLYSHPPQPHQQAVFSLAEQIRHCKVCIDVLEQIAPSSTTRARLLEHINKLEASTRESRKTRGILKFVVLALVFLSANIYLLLQSSGAGMQTIQEWRNASDSSVLFLFNLGVSGVADEIVDTSMLASLVSETKHHHMLVGRTFGHGWYSIPHSIGNTNRRVTALHKAIEAAADRRKYPDWTYQSYQKNILSDLLHAHMDYPISVVYVCTDNRIDSILPHQIGIYTQ